MRTTIRMKPEVAKKATEFAAQTQQTFTQLIEHAVLDYIQRNGKVSRRKRVVFPVVGDPQHKVSAEELRQAINSADLEYDLKKIGRRHVDD